jgi:hypothetical protein
VCLHDQPSSPRPALKRGIVRTLQRLLDVAISLLHLALNLLQKPFGLLIGTANGVTRFLLYFAGHVFHSTFDLIFVHENIP